MRTTKNVTELAVGSKAFYQGRYYRIDAATGTAWVLRGTAQGSNDAIAVNKPLVAIPAYQMFPLHTRVRSSGSFRGTVVAHEIETNRVVVISDKINTYTDGSKDRTRYAYTTRELSILPEPLFEINKLYNITESHKCGSTCVRVLEHTLNDDKFNLYNNATGEYLFTVYRSLSAADLPFNRMVTVHEVL